MAIITALSVGGLLAYTGIVGNATDKSQEVTVIKNSDAPEKPAWEKNFDESKDR